MTRGLNKLDIALVGVGGQGIILASDILAEVGLIAGFDVKKTDSLGMSQRGGSVLSFVRWAAKVYSPMPKRGDVDVLLALEKLEAGRAASPSSTTTRFSRRPLGRAPRATQATTSLAGWPACVPNELTS